ncbi:hypothetical protein M406DRAFT_328261 [Cryphonectria parasitica EP155]|uniref:Rhodopsin domain-containing protein n=1 Tax=Cryphonectria parasitica (strain ATCC 38755 / EP155) TaxID=660469 RepID=A0A9P5CRD5_CRYP1|nr:uncharacterized protein M406DRAFT_328261 [Cryphonectria parasitica EP155]KAF3767166.1 hypothetical protein M406DRAFT_328261 [Cryphonectria parasitica EP155]
MAGLKIFWVSGFFFGPNQLCAKMSILFLYHRIFGKNAAYARWTLFLGLVQIACTIVEVLVNTFQCAPVRKFWDLKEKDGHCIDTGVYLVTMESVNSTVDFAMAILAMYMLRDLQMSLRAKIRGWNRWPRKRSVQSVFKGMVNRRRKYERWPKNPLQDQNHWYAFGGLDKLGDYPKGNKGSCAGQLAFEDLRSLHHRW